MIESLPASLKKIANSFETYPLNFTSFFAKTYHNYLDGSRRRKICFLNGKIMTVRDKVIIGLPFIHMNCALKNLFFDNRKQAAS